MSLLLVAQASSVPSGGIPVVDGDRLILQGDARYGTVTPVAVQGMPFAKAVRVATTSTPLNEWEFEVGTDATVAVKKGDVLLASVYVRAIKGQPETGEARAVLDFQVKGGEWSKSVSYPVPAGREWKRYDIPFTAGYDTDAGGANVAFRLGYGGQTIEIGGLSILNYANRLTLKDLPRTAIFYRGQEANAPWRKAALARIEKIRKGDLNLRILDERGKPVSGAEVRIEQVRHAFPFGSAVAADALVGEGADGDRYRATFLADFNRATIENHLKWPMWESEENQKVALRSLDWLNAKGISVRAHNAVWPSWRNSPERLQKLKDDPDALRRAVDEHIDDVVTSTRGKVDLWDVVNEPFDNHDITDILGPNAIGEWFERVRRIDPKALRVLNDYPPLDGAATNNAHLNDFYRRLAEMKRTGVPIQGIGFQCHVGGDPIPPERVLSGLDRFAKLGMPIEITEFDINSQDRDYQARYMRDFMIAMFSHPAVHGFTQWGFWAGRHWFPDAALYDQDWTLRPQGRAYLDLVNRQWRTKAAGKSGKDGALKLRGFYGDYRVTVRRPGRSAKTVELRLRRNGEPQVVRL